jgi:hypothetical protein
MYYADHEPAHFHAEFQGHRAKFDFEGRWMLGDFPSRKARRLIRRWAAAHADELAQNWASMKAGRALAHIEPLN